MQDQIPAFDSINKSELDFSAEDEKSIEIEIMDDMVFKEMAFVENKKYKPNNVISLANKLNEEELNRAENYSESAVEIESSVASIKGRLDEATLKAELK